MIAAVAIGVAGCSTSAGILQTVGSSVDNGREQGPVPAAGGSDTSNGKPQSDGTGGNGQNLYDINQANLLIIKTGTMSLQVAGLDAALAAGSQKISALGGYVSGSDRKGDGSEAGASVTYRIPAARWDDALVALRGLAIKVLGEQSQTEDVTGQVVDLGARISNLESTEQALQGIMAKAEKIADVLAVQAQLTDVRGQIEQLTAQRKHLEESAAFSTLTVSYSLKEQAVVQTTKDFDPGSEVDRASASLVDVLQGVATAGIWFGIVWLPILIVLGIVTVIVVFVARRVFRSGPSGPDSGWMPPVDAPAAAIPPAPES